MLTEAMVGHLLVGLPLLSISPGRFSIIEFTASGPESCPELSSIKMRKGSVTYLSRHRPLPPPIVLFHESRPIRKPSLG